MDVYLKRTLTGFTAADDASVDAMKGYRIGDVYRADIVKPRNLKNHRRWWALCTIIYQNTEAYGSTEQVSDHLKILSGHCNSVSSEATGQVYLLPKSIAFSSLDELEFQDVFDRAAKAVCEHIIPGINDYDLQGEVLKLVGMAA